MKYEFDINIICKECGNQLKAEINWRGSVLVEPCETCTKKLDVVKDWLVEHEELDVTEKMS